MEQDKNEQSSKELERLNRRIARLKKLLIKSRRFEQELKVVVLESDQIFKTATDGLCVIDKDFNILRANDAFLHLVGLPYDEIVGSKCYQVTGDSRCNTPDCSLIQIIDGKGRVESEVNKKIKEGKEILCMIIATPFRTLDGELIGIVENIRDITQIKQTERKLKASQRRLRNLSAHLESARENERKNVAREIHDELGQILTALKIDLSEIAIALPEESASVIEKTRSMSELIDTTIQTVQRISSDLRPRMLDDLGLVCALDWQASEFEKLAGIKCNLSYNPSNISIGYELSTAIFRIFQETLTNVLRHAKATKVEGHLEQSDNKIRLEIADNGIGITEEQLSSSKAFGLMGIRERVKYYNGIFTAKGVPGMGTKIYIEIPIKG